MSSADSHFPAPLRSEHGAVIDLRPYGPDAWLLTFADSPTAANPWRQALTTELAKNSPQPLRELIPGFASVLVQFEDRAPARAIIAQWIHRTMPGLATSAKRFDAPSGRAPISIPVVFDGADLARVAGQSQRTIAQAVELFCSTRFSVRCLGFSPGFPYLDGLPEPLHTPRLSVPRTQVPAGSVAIGGAHAGIYPQASAGGWNLIGRTSERLFDPTASNVESMFRLWPGDALHFEPVSPEALATTNASRFESSETNHPVRLEIIAPGMGLSVQDLGRPGFRRFGVPGGGAMDPAAAIDANRLLENQPTEAVLELCGRGHRFRVKESLWVALSGANTPTPGRAITVRLQAGETLEIPAGPLSGLWTYLAIPGGVAETRCLGSAAASPRIGLGRLLRSGDLVRGNPASERSWPLAVARRSIFHAPTSATGRLRVWQGPQWDWFSESTRSAFFETAWLISPQSDRTGYRLLGPSLVSPAHEMTSEPVLPGSIQIPPNGLPIVTMPDGPTLGGYPKLGLIEPEDLIALAQSPPGTRVRFVPMGEST